MGSHRRAKIVLSIETQAIQNVQKAVLREADGKALRKDLRTDLKSAVQPGVTEVQQKLRGMPSSSAKPALGSYLASKTKVAIRLSGRRTGIRVWIPFTPQLRGFTNAPRYLNKGFWRHTVFGNKNNWVGQVSPIPGFFDDTLKAHKEEYKQGVLNALHDMAQRIARRSSS